MQRINFSLPAMLLTLRNAQPTDQGYFVVCAWINGKDPCGSFYLEVLPPPTPDVANPPHLTETLDAMSSKWI